MQKLTGTIQNFAWGSPTAIPAILGTEPTGEPVAEYWMGAHLSSPSVVAGQELDYLVAASPEVVGDASRARFGDRLPYLLKILAAEKALSLQAHPTRAQAEEGYARENEAGVPLDAFERTYRDDWPKPEALVALTEFHALCGFRDPLRTAELFNRLGCKASLDSVIGPLTRRKGSAALAEVFLDALSLEESRRHLVTEVVAAAVAHVDDEGEMGLFARTAVELDEYYPGDPGIFGALLMNRVVLAPGEALFLDAGLLHAYLKGTGIEIMANSDNVLRGGLTPKHIDVEQLVSVVQFEPGEPPHVTTELEQPGIFRFRTPAPEFALWRLLFDDPEGREPRVLPAPGTGRIVLVTDGHLLLTQGKDELELVRGEAAFVPATDEEITLAGSAEAFVAAPGTV